MPPTLIEPETTSVPTDLWTESRHENEGTPPQSLSAAVVFGPPILALNSSDAALTSAVRPTNLSSSFAYRKRIAITVICVIVGLCGTLMTKPDVREGTPLDHLYDRLGWFVLAFALMLRLWTSGHISGRKLKTLVTSGPYAICRNPQYIATLLIAISQILFLKSYPFALACIFPIGLYIVGVVPAEESRLRERFGTNYVEYCRQVPRWSMRWKALNYQWRNAENWTAFRNECVRCFWWLLLPIASEVICAIRELIWSAL